MKGHELLRWALNVGVGDEPRPQLRGPGGKLLDIGDRGFRPPRRAVLVSYVAHVNWESGLAWLSIETLEHETQFDRKTILPARVKLIEHGLLLPAGRHGRSGVPQFRVGCPINGISEVGDNSAQKSRARDFRRISGIPPTDAQESHKRDLTASHQRDTEQGFELGTEQRDPARGARLSGWKPDPEARAWAREKRPDLHNLDEIEAKFSNHHGGTSRSLEGWRRLWESWICSERSSSKSTKALVPSTRDEAAAIRSALKELRLMEWAEPETIGQARRRVVDAGGEDLLKVGSLVKAAA